MSAWFLDSELSTCLPIILCIPIAPPIIPFLFYCANDNITMQEWLCIIYIVTDCFNRIFEYSIRVSRSFWKLGSKHLGRPGSCQAYLWLCYCLKLMYLMFIMLQPF